MLMDWHPAEVAGESNPVKIIWLPMAASSFEWQSQAVLLEVNVL